MSILHALFGDGKKSKRDDEAYYDEDDSLQRYDSNLITKSMKYGSEAALHEYEFVTEQNQRIFNAGDICYLVDAHWLSKWLSFVSPPDPNTPSHDKHRTPHRPGRITNHVLLNQFGQFNGDLQLKTDYRPVNGFVWKYLFARYGGGPVVLFYIPVGCKEKHYKNGSWIKTVLPFLPDITFVIHPCENPERKPYVNLTEMVLERNKLLEAIEREKVGDVECVNRACNNNATASIFETDTEKNALTEKAGELKAEMNEELTSSIALDMISAAQSKQALDDAAALEEEIQQEKAASIMESVALAMLASQDMKDIANMIPSADDSPEIMEKLRNTCARVIQSKYRSRLVNRSKMLEKQKKLDEVRRLKIEGYARKVQSAWRRRQASVRMKALKQERLEVVMKKSAIMLQKVYRKRMALKAISNLKANREKELRLADATMKLHGFLRVCVAKFHFRKLLASSHEHIVIVKLKSASNLVGTNMLNDTSDPYCKIVGSRFVSSSAKGASGRIVKSKQGVTKSLSCYTSKTIHSTVNPVWNEEAFVAGVHGTDSIVINVYDSDTFTTDMFLGQAEICLKDYPGLFSSTMGSYEIDIDDIPLKVGNTLIHDADGAIVPCRDCTIPESRKKDKHRRGFLSVSIRLPALINNMCDFVHKLSGSVIPGMPKVFKRRYMVLKEGLLVYFDDNFTLEDPRYEVWCQDVMHIEDMMDHSGKELESFYIAFGSDSWTVKFDENSSSIARREWMRKIRFNCFNVNKNIKGASRLANFPLLLNVRNKISAPVNNGVSSPVAAVRPRRGSNTSQNGEDQSPAGGTRVTRRRSLLGGVIGGAVEAVGGAVGAVGGAVGAVGGAVGSAVGAKK